LGANPGARAGGECNHRRPFIHSFIHSITTTTMYVPLLPPFPALASITACSAYFCPSLCYILEPRFILQSQCPTVSIVPAASPVGISSRRDKRSRALWECSRERGEGECLPSLSQRTRVNSWTEPWNDLIPSTAEHCREHRRFPLPAAVKQHVSVAACSLVLPPSPVMTIQTNG
jgi:hypothetical protein